MDILSFDLGSRIGWSVFHLDLEERVYSDVASGFFDLVCGKSASERSKNIKKSAKAEDHSTRGFDPRPLSMFDLCSDLNEEYYPECVAFEDVQFFNSLYQTQLWGSLRGAMWASLGIDKKWVCHDVGTIKKFISGRGDASKDMMISSIWNFGFTVSDDNEADAIGIGMITCEMLLNPKAKKIENFQKKC